MCTENVFELLKRRALSQPSKQALICNQHTYSYQELYELSLAFSTALHSHGLQPQEAVCVSASNSIEFIALLFAIAKEKAVFIPFASLLEQSKEVVEQLKPQWFILKCDEYQALSSSSHLRTQFVSCTNLSNGFVLCKMKEIEHMFQSPIKGAAFIRMTSGTTGKPKAVLISHKTALTRITTAQQALQVNSNDIIGWPLLMAYHFVVSILLYIQEGACIALCNSSHLLRDIVNLQVTRLYASPYEVNLIVEQAPYLPETLQEIYSTSSGLDMETVKRFITKFPNVSLTQLYGMIEVGLPFGRSYKQDDDNHTRAFWAACLPGFYAEVRDDLHQKLPPGTPGKLYVKGPGTLDAYYGSENIETDAWFPTGDIAVANKNNEFQILGRSKLTFQIEKLSIYPEIIEAELKRHPAVREARVYSGKSKAVCADVTLKQEKQFLEIETELSSTLKTFINNDAVAFHINRVEELDRTQSGKIKR